MNSTTKAAQVLIAAAAEMQRTLENLYTAELTAENTPSPLEIMAEPMEFQSADPIDGEPIDDNEMEDV